MNNNYGIESTKKDRGFYELKVGDKTYWLQSPEWTEGMGWLLTDVNGNNDTLHFECKKFAVAHVQAEVVQQELEVRGNTTKIVVTPSTTFRSF